MLFFLSEKKYIVITFANSVKYEEKKCYRNIKMFYLHNFVFNIII